MEGGLAISFGSQTCNSDEPHHTKGRLWLSSLFMSMLSCTTGCIFTKPSPRPWATLWTPAHWLSSEVIWQCYMKLKKMLSSDWILWRLQHVWNNIIIFVTDNFITVAGPQMRSWLWSSTSRLLDVTMSVTTHSLLLDHSCTAVYLKISGLPHRWHFIWKTEIMCI